MTQEPLPTAHFLSYSAVPTFLDAQALPIGRSTLNPKSPKLSPGEGGSHAPRKLTLVVPAAAEMISTFLKASSHNLKYVGIDALSRIVRINAKYANEHQLAVIDCLEDPDESLKRKTLELLFKMTNPNNVEVRAGLAFAA